VEYFIKKKKKKPPGVICMCRKYAGKFIPNLHPLVAALLIQYSLFILLCLWVLLQVTYLRAWAMNMRMQFLKIISHTYVPDSVFDSCTRQNLPGIQAEFARLCHPQCFRTS